MLRNIRYRFEFRLECPTWNVEKLPIGLCRRKREIFETSFIDIYRLRHFERHYLYSFTNNDQKNVVYEKFNKCFQICRSVQTQQYFFKLLLILGSTYLNLFLLNIVFCPEFYLILKVTCYNIPTTWADSLHLSVKINATLLLVGKKLCFKRFHFTRIAEKRFF